MKKSILTVTLIFTLILGVLAKSSPVVLDYVVTNGNNITFVSKLKTHNKKLIGITESGDRINFEKSEVKAYRKNGREFKRMNLDNKEMFLERIITSAGYTIYQKLNAKTIKDIFVYRGEILEHKLDKENYKIILRFFFPTMKFLQ